MLSALASVLISGHVDSGCSGSLTPHRDALINTRPNSERFKAADGLEYKAELIGDMPVIVKDTSGRRLCLVLRNVRLVPGFKYTLLSVRQLWNEQRISSQFDDTNSLVINTVDGVVRIPFAPSAGLPLVHLVSDTTNSTGGDPATGCRALSAEAPASCRHVRHIRHHPTCLDKPTAPRRHLGMSDMSDMSYDMTCRICRNMS